jgi:hypothetical protein
MRIIHSLGIELPQQICTAKERRLKSRLVLEFNDIDGIQRLNLIPWYLGYLGDRDPETDPVGELGQLRI